MSDGDPGVAIGPTPGPNGFSWGNGSRLNFSNLTANFAATRSDQAFKGFEAIAVSRTDERLLPPAATRARLPGSHQS